VFKAFSHGWLVCPAAAMTYPVVIASTKSHTKLLSTRLQLNFALRTCIATSVLPPVYQQDLCTLHYLHAAQAGGVMSFREGTKTP
jgi:hypothetical protein